jgi:hypothetical protein
VVKGCINVLIVGLIVLSFNGVDRDIEMADQGGRNIILGAQGIAGTEDKVGASRGQNTGQVCCFGGDVQATADAYPMERSFPCKTLHEKLHYGHFLVSPFDAVQSNVSQGNIFNIVSNDGHISP